MKLSNTKIKINSESVGNDFMTFNNSFDALNFADENDLDFDEVQAEKF